MPLGGREKNKFVLLTLEDWMSAIKQLMLMTLLIPAQHIPLLNRPHVNRAKRQRHYPVIARAFKCLPDDKFVNFDFEKRNRIGNLAIFVQSSTRRPISTCEFIFYTQGNCCEDFYRDLIV